MRKRTLFFAAGLVALLAGHDAVVAGAPAGTVSYLVGTATRTAGGKSEELKKGSTVFQDDVIETGDKARLELKLNDKSVIRLAPKSKTQLKAASFEGGPDNRKFSASLALGNVWAKVTSAVGGDAKFEVETENAVAGVRGTTFRVDARADKTTLVKVYAGSVAVGPSAPIYSLGHKKAERKLVSGPQQVSREQWEKLVGRMMQIVVGADGRPTEPTAFDEKEDAKDEWVAWNTERDKAGE
jgi:hypothetical protein